MTATATAATAQTPVQFPRLSVCLSPSQKLSLSERVARIVLAESNAIWMPYGVSVRWVGESESGCDRLITVKGDQEARPEDAAGASALGWVPFTEGRASQLVFLRVGHARTMVDALSSGTRPAELAAFMLARLLGRSLAHELGHVLLNSRTHEESGLMRAHYRARDVVSAATSAYTLNAAERARLFTRIATGSRVALR